MLARQNRVRCLHVLALFFVLTIYAVLMQIADYLPLEMMIFVMCWVGIFQALSCAVSWKRMSGGWFSMQFVFMLFCYMFNYGQCFMWAFGIHVPRDLSVDHALYVFDTIQAKSLFMTQVFTLTVLFIIHFALLVTYRKKDVVVQQKTGKSESVFLSANLFASYVIFPVSLYLALRGMIKAASSGYISLYYGEGANSGNTILILISMMFFSNVMGLLIANKQCQIKWVNKYVYGVLIAYTLINFAGGDRGFVWQWMILIFWYMQTYRKGKIKISKILLYAIPAYVALGFLSAVTIARRTVGFTAANLVEAFFALETPIASAFFETGGSMAPLLKLVQYGENPYPYGNTFLFALLGMVTERMIDFLGIPYKSLSLFFSFDFLRLNYGAGFSLIAELYMNFGFIWSIPFALLIGLCLGKVFSINLKGAMGELFSVASVSSMVYVARNTFQNGTKHFFYGVMVYCIMMYVLSYLLNRKRIR